MEPQDFGDFLLVATNLARASTELSSFIECFSTSCCPYNVLMWQVLAPHLKPKTPCTIIDTTLTTMDWKVHLPAQ